MKTGCDLLLPRGMTDYFDVVETEETDKAVFYIWYRRICFHRRCPVGVLPPKVFIRQVVDIHDFPIRDKGLDIKAN